MTNVHINLGWALTSGTPVNTSTGLPAERWHILQNPGIH